MLPRGSGRPIVTHGGFGGQESISLGEAHPTALPSWAQKALERLEVPPSTLHPVVSTLPNGLTLIVQSEDVSDTVSVYGHIRNRPETEELEGAEGVAQVLEPLLTHGSEHLDRVAFQQALDAIGAREHAGTDFSVQALAEHFERAVELLADNELHPALPQALTRSDPDYYPLQLGNAVLGGSFYATRLSIDLRKNSGLVYSVQSLLQAGRTRSVYLVEYASDPRNVAKAADMVAREVTAMQDSPVGADELTRVKACLLRQLPLTEASLEQIAHGVLARSDLGLPLDEPTAAAKRYIALEAAEVQGAFRKWLRPKDLVRVSEGPTPP